MGVMQCGCLPGCPGLTPECPFILVSLWLLSGNSNHALSSACHPGDPQGRGHVSPGTRGLAGCLACAEEVAGVAL